jgi:hypothetical protein
MKRTILAALASAVISGTAYAQSAQPPQPGGPSGRGAVTGDPAASSAVPKRSPTTGSAVHSRSGSGTSSSGGRDANGDQGRDAMPDSSQAVRPNNKPDRM